MYKQRALRGAPGVRGVRPPQEFPLYLSALGGVPPSPSPFFFGTTSMRSICTHAQTRLSGAMTWP